MSSFIAEITTTGVVGAMGCVFAALGVEIID
jgi:hypothetical protein